MEVYARYSTLDIGSNIFTAGFADPNLWTNHAATTDIGLNWYLNFYTRIYLDWQHAMFGNQVSIAPSISRRHRPLLAAVPGILLSPSGRRSDAVLRGRGASARLFGEERKGRGSRRPPLAFSERSAQRFGSRSIVAVSSSS